MSLNTFVVSEILPTVGPCLQIPIVLVVHDLPSPIAVGVDQDQSPTFFELRATIRVRLAEFRDPGSNETNRYVCSPGDGVNSHVNYPVNIGYCQEVHEHPARLVVSRDAGFEDLIEDFGVQLNIP